MMLEQTKPVVDRAGGINFDHQYGLTLRFGFGSSNDPGAHAVVQEVLAELGDVMECYVDAAGSRGAAGPKPVLSYGFPGAFIVTDDDGTKREMSFLAEGDALGDRRVGASRYEIDLTIEFEADSDSRGRDLAGAIANTMRAGLSRFGFQALSIESLNLVGYEFESPAPETNSSALSCVERPVGLRAELATSAARREDPDLGI